MKVKPILYLVGSLFFLPFVAFISIYSNDDIYKKVIKESKTSSIAKIVLDKSDLLVN